MLTINQKQLKQIITHAQKIYPEECCGILLGKISNNTKTTIQIWETENSWDLETATLWEFSSGSKKNRFMIAPEVLLKAQKTAREQDLAIIGFYHSHPDNPSIPSEFDTAIAHQSYSYVIVSLIKGVEAHFTSWTLNGDHQFEAEEIINI